MVWFFTYIWFFRITAATTATERLSREPWIPAFLEPHPHSQPACICMMSYSKDCQGMETWVTASTPNHLVAKHNLTNVAPDDGYARNVPYLLLMLVERKLKLELGVNRAFCNCFHKTVISVLVQRAQMSSVRCFWKLNIWQAITHLEHT